MISDSIPENTIFPDSIRTKGYFSIITWTCPDCCHENKMQIPTSGAVESVERFCQACGILTQIDLKGLDGEE